MRRVMVVAALAVCVALVGAAASGASPAAGWHVGYYNNSQLSNAQAAKGGDGSIASLDFTSAPNTALLVTSDKSLTGDLTGKTITATATVSGATGAFTYYGEPDGCNSPANWRLYFETSNAGGFAYTHYWWSNPTSAVLANGTLTVTATVDPASWSDWNGKLGTDQSASAGFAAAAANVTAIGVSFGGGCFFENGVGTTDGSGTFALNSFATS